MNKQEILFLLQKLGTTIPKNVIEEIIESIHKNLNDIKFKETYINNTYYNNGILNITLEKLGLANVPLERIKQIRIKSQSLRLEKQFIDPKAILNDE